MVAIKTPSLFLSWLPGSAMKGIAMPEIVIDEGLAWSGYYNTPSPKRARGLIRLRDDNPSTIAHEWRHHMQWAMGWEGGWDVWQSTGRYREDIVQFFRNKRELDALLFQRKYAPLNDTVNIWWEWINESKGTVASVQAQDALSRLGQGQTKAKETGA